MTTVAAATPTRGTPPAPPGDARFGDPAAVFGRHARTIFCLAWLYLLLPTLVVLAGFQRAFVAIPVLAAGAAASWWMLRGSQGAPAGTTAPSLGATWPHALLAAALVWFAGALPPFGENLDWAKHYALFNELIGQGWPPPIPTDDGLATLRYSLSYYVVPALVAKIGGHAWLGPAIFAWTAFGAWLALTLAFGVRRGRLAARLFPCLAFLLFSGADIVGTWINDSKHPLVMHFEWWAGFGQLSSIATSLIWTPQHALSAWIGAFLLLRYPAQALRGGAVLLAAVAIWSPFSAVGLAPLFAWSIARRGMRALWSKVNLLAGPVLLLAAAWYLTRGAAQRIPSSFVWQTKDFTAALWIEFVLLEFVLPVLALLLMRPASRSLVLANGAFLLLLSLVSVGVYNDLLMRGSGPALAVLALVGSQALAAPPHGWRKLPFALCLLAGLATPASEIVRAFILPRMADSRTIGIPDIVGHPYRKLEGQYLVPGYDGPLGYRTVRELPNLGFEEFGAAHFNRARRLIASEVDTDAALVSEEIALPAGLYRLDLTLDWDVQAAQAGTHAAHVSLHGRRTLIRIAPSRAAGRQLTTYFRTQGEPVRIAVGLGGWSRGRGQVQLRALRLRAVSAGE